MKSAKIAEKVFIRPQGHRCLISTGIHDCLTFGTGKLDTNGFWEHPCGLCARAHEKQFPEGDPCWPHKKATLKNRIYFRGVIVKSIKRGLHGYFQSWCIEYFRHHIHTGKWPRWYWWFKFCSKMEFILRPSIF